MNINVIEITYTLWYAMTIIQDHVLSQNDWLLGGTISVPHFYFLNVTYEECYIHFWNYSETKIVSKSFYVYTAKMNYKRVLDCTSPKPPKLFLDNITIWSFSLSKVSLIIFNDVGDIKETKFIIIYLINEISSNILMIVILIKRYVIFNCNKI